MSLLLDSGIVYAYYDRRDAWHTRARDVIEGADGGLVLPGPVIPEVDWLLGQRLGARSRLVFYAGMIEGAYLVADLPQSGYARVAELTRRFQDLDLGFVDAAVAVMAGTLGIRRIATTDRRHFTPLAKPLDLELVP